MKIRLISSPDKKLKATEHNEKEGEKSLSINPAIMLMAITSGNFLFLQSEK